MLNSPTSIQLINAWLAIEALQPQTFIKQEKLVDSEKRKHEHQTKKSAPRQLLVSFDVQSGIMPWQTSVGDRARLNIAADETIRWYIPIAFIQMKPAVELLVKDFEANGPEREPASGVSVLAMMPFDERGYPLTSGLLLSSFGWACGEVLQGRVDRLHQYPELEGDLCREIGDALIERAEDGLQLPTGMQGFKRCMTVAMQTLNLPKDILERSRVAIRVIGDAEKEPVDIINSFFLRDLHRVRREIVNGNVGATLCSYLGQIKPREKHDVLANYTVLESFLAPKYFPLARWPAPKPARLVTLQQTAVNAAMNNLKAGGLLAVNGPPGTGKTTLLRDVVAGIVIGRADKLAEFSDPECAFTPKDVVVTGSYSSNVSALDKSLRGFGMLVASSNNAAVRNVSAELPRVDAIAEDVVVTHFSGTADTVQRDEGGCWGLIAAVLGNKANCYDFVEDAWWHPDWGLQKYFAAATGKKKNENDPIPAIVGNEKPPANKREALERWRQARLEYREARTKVGIMRSMREQFRVALMSAADAQQAAIEAQAQAETAANISQHAMNTLKVASEALESAASALDDARRMLEGQTALKPNILLRLLSAGRKWRMVQEQRLADMDNARADHEHAKQERISAEQRAEKAECKVKEALALLELKSEELLALTEIEEQAQQVCDDRHVGPQFWLGEHEDIHNASPWMDDEFTHARDKMFVASLKLHRAFIDAAARPLKDNLGVIMQHLKGKRVPSGADIYLADLWDSLFLVVPLVSTTFASADRLLDGLGKEAIGWLIVDEAGQAPPQQAIGALWRAKRALIIGDPLQIEPISKVPVGLVRAICNNHDAHPDIWTAPNASVQTLADTASPLGAKLTSGGMTRNIGLPLLVHRRCQNPMFSISNEIAYGGLMVHAASGEFSQIKDTLSEWLPGSSWVHVESKSEKWSQQEGNAVLDLLNKLAAGGVRQPSLYIISPFREVADRLRIFVLKSGVLDRLGVPANKQRDWGTAHVGTVHTFQGKEAEAVLLVLGASSKEKRGSRNWAGGVPNILNVAATRAKKVMYVIGHRNHWSRAGVFATAAANLPVCEWPFETAENRDKDVCLDV